MRTPLPHSLARALALSAAALATACSDAQTTAPSDDGSRPLLARSERSEHRATLAELRRATARYHDIDAAIADGFIPVTAGCAEEEGGEIMPIPYANIERLTDGRIDPSLPDALLFEPRADGRMTLVGVELAIPFAQWAAAAPPTFLGVTLQREEALGVYGVHVWVWSHNPEGMFAEANPRVTCGVTDAG